MQDFQQLMDSLTEDEQKFLRGLVYMYAGIARQVSPTSAKFAIEQAIGRSEPQAATEAAQAAQKGLIDKGLIVDAQCKFLNPQFQNWIQCDLFKTKFGKEGTPPAGLKIYPPCDRLDQNLLDH